MRSRSDQNKIQRLREIERLLLDHPKGLLPAEIARSLCVHKSTIGRYLPDLPDYIARDENTGRWVINRDRFPVEVKLDRHEALALHLAARMLATRTDHYYPKAASALRKLAAAMDKPAPFLSRHMKISAEIMSQKKMRVGDHFLDNLEKLTGAWADGKKVRIGYRKSRASRKKYFVISPYFIEPYPLGQTTYLVGQVSPSGKMLTLKIERIEDIEILNEDYVIDPDFDPRQQLDDAWSIWFTGGDPVEVVLQFSANVADRVCETRWHPSQSIEPCNGGLLWKARVAEPIEMLPWIRSWGVDVEVIKPENIRELLVGEAIALSEKYGQE